MIFFDFLCSDTSDFIWNSEREPEIHSQTEKGTFCVTYPGCRGGQGNSVHITGLLPLDSQIISPPWHCTRSTALGCPTVRDITSLPLSLSLSACVWVCCSTACRLQTLRAACHSSLLHFFFNPLCHPLDKTQTNASHFHSGHRRMHRWRNLCLRTVFRLPPPPAV